MENIVFCPWIILNVNGPMHKSNNDNSWFNFKNVDVETILPMCKITFCDCRFFDIKLWKQTEVAYCILSVLLMVTIDICTFGFRKLYNTFYMKRIT